MTTTRDAMGRPRSGTLTVVVLLCTVVAVGVVVVQQYHLLHTASTMLPSLASVSRSNNNYQPAWKSHPPSTSCHSNRPEDNQTELKQQEQRQQTLPTTPHERVEFWTDDCHAYVKRDYTHVIRRRDDDQLTYRLAYRGHYNVRIVFFVNCKINPNYAQWIDGYLRYLPASSHRDVTELTIVASASNCTAETPLHNALERQRLIWNTSLVQLECHNDLQEETYEYHGIHKIWQWGQETYGSNNNNDNDKSDGDNTILLYMHSKGLTHRSEFDNRPGIVRPVLTKYHRVIEALDLFPTVSKVGFYYGGRGLVWYNFFYARASYVQQVEEPIRTDRRHYYEDWLSRIHPPTSAATTNGTTRNNDTATTKEELPVHVYPESLSSCYALGYKDGSRYANLGVAFNPDTKSHDPHV